MNVGPEWWTFYEPFVCVFSNEDLGLWGILTENHSPDQKWRKKWWALIFARLLISVSCFSSFACRFSAVWGSGLDGRPSGSSYSERLRVCLWSTRTTTTRARSSSLRLQTSKKWLIWMFSCSFVFNCTFNSSKLTIKLYYSVSCDSVLSLNFSLVYHIVQIIATKLLRTDCVPILKYH